MHRHIDPLQKTRRYTKVLSSYFRKRPGCEDIVPHNVSRAAQHFLTLFIEANDPALWQHLQPSRDAESHQHGLEAAKCLQDLKEDEELDPETVQSTIQFVAARIRELKRMWAVAEFASKDEAGYVSQLDRWKVTAIVTTLPRMLKKINLDNIRP